MPLTGPCFPTQVPCEPCQEALSSGSNCLLQQADALQIVDMAEAVCRAFWRYNILYVSERCFESGGRIWDHIFDEVCWCLWILSTFTG